MLPYCLLGWAEQRAPIYPLYMMRRSLGCYVVPTLASSFLASFGALRERNGAFNA